MDTSKIRRDFPLLAQDASHKPVVYLDNACQSLRPRAVMDAMTRYYESWSACSGRSMHRLGDEVTRACEETRAAVAKFLNVSRSEEIVFTRNTTEGLNLVAHALEWEEGDVVLLTDKEHNSNLLPWLELAKRRGVVVRRVQSREDNSFDVEALKRSLDKSVKLVSLGYTSNLDGVTIPAAQAIRLAHENGSLVLLDAAQTAPRRKMDVKALDVDLLAFSGHKLLGPTGTGILYGKYALLERLRPFIVGGGTVAWSKYDSCSFLPPPAKFEAGLQDYAGIIGLGAAIRYLEGVGFATIEKQEQLLNEIMTQGVGAIPRMRLLGPADARERGGICSFWIEGVDPHRIALMLDQMAGVMVRSGQHCVHSWFDVHGISGSVRASAYFYNTAEEAELFVHSLQKIARVL